MTEVLLRLHGVTEKILELLIRKGYYKTRSEAIRAGILELGKEYAIIKDAAYHRRELEKIVSEKKMTTKQILKAVNALEE